MKVTVIAGNGIGGTEKAAYLFAAELARRGHEIETLTDTANFRLDQLTNAGVTIRNVRLCHEDLLDHFKTSKPNVIHQHTSGYGDHRALYAALDSMGADRPKLIETNVFGRLMDRYDEGHVNLRMFVSMASGCQAFSRPMIGKRTPAIERHTVLYNPLPHQPSEALHGLPTVTDRRYNSTEASNPSSEFRESLGLSLSDFVFVRVGRPGHKWASWECDAFQRARHKVPHIKLILMEPTSMLHDAIRQGTYGDGIVVLAATSDQEFIDRLYQSSDAMLHASRFGESYGYTLAEGMRAGLPVITRTTPWADNAQVELVQHGETGYVCCGVEGMARAIVNCATSPAARETMSLAARSRVAGLSDLSGETDLLEEVMGFATAGVRGPLMKERFAKWMAYRESGFLHAEWRVYEDDLGMKAELIRSKTFAAYRQFRNSTRAFVSGLKAGLPK